VTRGSHTWQEILSQPRAWRATLHAFDVARPALEGFLRRLECGHILVVGCGSTYYLAQATAAIIRHWTGVATYALPSSELWLFPGMVPMEQSCLLAVSRSGTTTETLRALEVFRQTTGGPVLVVTCYPESPLAQQADLTLAAPDAQEESIAQTRSFTSMFLLTQALAAILAFDEGRLQQLHRLPDALEELVGRLGELPQHLGADLDIERIFFLGSGPLYGLASEAMLKAKEMSLSYAEAYHPLEFRHGPMSMVDGHTLVVGLLCDTVLAKEVRVLKEMQGLGACVLALAEDSSALEGWQPDHLVELQSKLGEWERCLLYLPVLQRLAYHRALAKGLDPDRPHNLTAVVTL
jgi:glucosamine--fructose-6-phosphate aminotransferase (isomerizing)